MRVVLRHASIGLYYAGRKHWVGNPAAAKDLCTIEQAFEASRDETFGDLDIVATYDDPSCELVLPARHEKGGSGEPLKAAA
jgi:hypothetical protein